MEPKLIQRKEILEKNDTPRKAIVWQKARGEELTIKE